MAVNKPTGDNARKGAVKKGSQTKTKIGGATGWTKRNKKSGESRRAFAWLEVGAPRLPAAAPSRAPPGLGSSPQLSDHAPPVAQLGRQPGRRQQQRDQCGENVFEGDHRHERARSAAAAAR